jgi:hypothetical protein
MISLDHSGTCHLNDISSELIPCGFSEGWTSHWFANQWATLREINVLALAHAYEQATEWHKRGPSLNQETKVPPLAVTDEAN